MAVITAFNFDDFVATCCSARNTNGIHSGFGARVSETPHRQAITRGQHFGHIGIGLTWRHKQGALTQLYINCGAHMWVLVTRKQGSKAHVVVGVHVAIDVGHVGAVRRTNNYWVRVVRLETGRHPEREHFAGASICSLGSGRSLCVGGQFSFRNLFGFFGQSTSQRGIHR